MRSASASSGPTALARRGLLRWSSRDGWLVAAAIVQGALTVTGFSTVESSGIAGALAAATIFAALIWWGSNTVCHNHLHNPLFRSRMLNAGWSLYLSVIHAVPQSIWRERHLRHHAGDQARTRPGLARGAALELLAIGFVWSAVGTAAPRVLLAAAIGYALGMGLCRLQGNMEHALAERSERGISYYGHWHNLLWFNDGHHAEHHRWPGLHWTRLPERRARISAVESRYPPALRAIEPLAARSDRLQGKLLGALERLALGFGAVQRFMIETHLAAFRKLLAELPAPPAAIGIVGGGLFPRTLIVLRRLLPEAQLVVIDCSAENVRRARDFLVRRGLSLAGVEFRIEAFDPRLHARFDLLVVPLALVGDRAATTLVGGFVATHDWLWRRAGEKSAVVSWLLLKRLNLHWPRLGAIRPLPERLPEAA
jgi:fatty acid desaturase